MNIQARPVSRTDIHLFKSRVELVRVIQARKEKRKEKEKVVHRPWGRKEAHTFEELKDHFARKTVNSRVNNTKEWGPNPEGREGPRTFCPKS